MDGKVRYCSACNAMVSMLEIKYAKIDYECPFCKKSTLSRCYSVDSTYHKDLINGTILQPFRIYKIPALIEKSVNEKILHLVLTYPWFDEIVSGNKRIEYREQPEHWKKLIWDKRDEITHIRFQRGYAKNPETVIFKVTNIDSGVCPIDGWNDWYFRIHFKEQYK